MTTNSSKPLAENHLKNTILSYCRPSKCPRCHSSGFESKISYNRFIFRHSNIGRIVWLWDLMGKNLPSPFWTYFPYFVQEVLGRTNRLLSLIRHGPHWKRLVQQFFYCCVCIRYRGNVPTVPLPSNDKGIFTEPLPSTNRGIHIQTYRLMGRIF
jgi:hypothetical protein